MTRLFSISNSRLGIKGVKDFISDDLKSLWELIRTDYGVIKTWTLYVRHECKSDEELQKHEKERLPYCLPTGIFTYRNYAGLADYSCYACFDIDGKIDVPEEAEYLDKVWEELKECPLVVLMWRSVRMGIKFIVEHDSVDPSQHCHLMVAIVGELERRGVDMAKVDTYCYDITRAHFISYDPGAILKDSNEVYHYEPVIPTKPFNPQKVKQKSVAIEKLLPQPKIYDDEWSAIQAVQKESDERFPVVMGHRNQNVFIFASKLHDSGVSKAMAAKYLVLRYSEEDFPASEISIIINKLYA